MFNLKPLKILTGIAIILVISYFIGDIACTSEDCHPAADIVTGLLFMAWFFWCLWLLAEVAKGLSEPY